MRSKRMLLSESEINYFIYIGIKHSFENWYRLKKVSL